MNDTLRDLWARLGIPPGYSANRRLPVYREARRVVVAGRDTEGRIVRLAPPAAAAWHRLREAARRDGLNLLPVSGFRSVARQAGIIRRKQATGATVAEILKLVAAPGCSEHHTGRALDIGAPGHTRLEADFARTPEFRWLKRHAATYGFTLSYPRRNAHGIAYEPWHWCWHRPRRR